MRGLAVAFSLVIGLIVATVWSGEAVAQSAETSYADAATGINFRAPVGLSVTASRTGVNGRTTQAIFATYRGADDPKVTVDLGNHLVITAYIASRQPNEDLRSWAARNAGPATYTVAELPRLNGILLSGLFQTGARKYALIPKSSEQVLIVDAFPTTSKRIGIFDGVLASMEVR